MPVKAKIHQLAHTIVSGKVKGVRESAIRAGGEVTWSFSQVENPTRALICSMNETSIGICEMLSAKWLELHAKGDHIANWLTPNSYGFNVDLNKIRNLMQLYTIGTTMAPGKMTEQNVAGNADQERATQEWLRGQGVVRRGNIIGLKMGKNVMYGEKGTTVQRGANKRRVLAAQLGAEITRSYESYKMVYTVGSHFAHACAAWSAQDVAYFDPNFGEFWFKRPAEFVAWFPTYWHLAGYGTPVVGLSESYRISEYVRPVGKR